MMRKPRYYVEFAIIGQIDEGEVLGKSDKRLYTYVGKSDKRLYTYDDLEFMFRLANPFYADEWMFGVKMLRRHQFTVLKVQHKNGVQVIRVIRY